MFKITQMYVDKEREMYLTVSLQLFLCICIEWTGILEQSFTKSCAYFKFLQNICVIRTEFYNQDAEQN